MTDTLLKVLLGSNYGNQRSFLQRVTLAASGELEYEFSPSDTEHDDVWLLYDITFSSGMANDVLELVIDHERIARHKIAIQAPIKDKGFQTFIFIDQARPLSLRLKNLDAGAASVFEATFWFFQIGRTGSTNRM